MVATLPLDDGKRPEVAGGAAHVADQPLVGHAALGPGGGGGVVGAGPGRLPEVEVGADGQVAVGGELPGDLLGPLVVAGHVVDHHHPTGRGRRRGAGPDRPRSVSPPCPSISTVSARMASLIDVAPSLCPVAVCRCCLSGRAPATVRVDAGRRSWPVEVGRRARRGPPASRIGLGRPLVPERTDPGQGVCPAGPAAGRWPRWPRRAARAALGRDVSPPVLRPHPVEDVDVLGVEHHPDLGQREAQQLLEVPDPGHPGHVGLASRAAPPGPGSRSGGSGRAPPSSAGSGW